MLLNTDIKATITITVYDYLDIDLLDTVRIESPQEKISQNFYVKSFTFTLADDNTRVTELILSPYNIIA